MTVGNDVIGSLTPGIPRYSLLDSVCASAGRPQESPTAGQHCQLPHFVSSPGFTCHL